MVGHRYRQEGAIMGNVFSFTVGEMTVHVLGDIGTCYPAENIFSGANPIEIRDELNTYYPEQPCIAFPFHPVLIDWNGRYLMLDTGNDGLGGVPQLLKNGLAEVGIQPEQVHDVLLTHAHADHISGCANAEGKPFFPNATYHISVDEWDFWRQPKVLNSTDKHATAIRRELIPIADRVQTFVPGYVLDGVEALSAYGHTPGNVVFRLSSQGETLYYLGDTYINPVHIAHPQWDFDLDMAFDAARATRQALLAEMALPHVTVTGYHFMFPAVGQVVKTADAGYIWQAGISQKQPTT